MPLNRFIIDTDTAGDDCFALMLALSDPDTSVEAITICNGNVDFDQQVENALYTLDVMGSGGRVPVFEGCRRALLRAPIDATYVFGQDGMSDMNYPRTRQRAAPGHAVDAIIDSVMSSPGEISLIALAPLTNIALAVAKEPRIADAARHLWIMGGTDNGIGNVTPAAEFNIYVDPEAASIVLRAGFRISMFTWTGTVAHSLLTGEDLDAIAALGTPRSRFFTDVNRQSARFSMARYGHGGTLHPDAMLMACALDHDMILGERWGHVAVSTDEGLTRGYTSVSSAMLPDQMEADPALGASPAANVRILERVDNARFRRRMREMLAR